MNKPVIVFDGHCRLCHWSVQFLLRHDHKRQFYFTTFDSAWSAKRQLKSDMPDSVLLVLAERTYSESAAFLKMMGLLGGFWSVLGIFWIVPTPLRNLLYRFIAKNRYRWFGRYDACPLPTPDLQARLLN
jgi:predicted DCC family thiol-disulfide oxidoreductase YuxK